MVKKYIPRQGDIVYLDFVPTKGHEQTGYRPAVVVSNNVFNDNNFASCCHCKTKELYLHK